MELTYRQKELFYEQGFVQVAGVVPPVLIADALRAINHSIGEGFPTEQLAFTRQQSYAKELQDQPVITDILNRTPALEYTESLVGKAMLRPTHGGQVALRFPGPHNPPSPPKPHLDGMHSPYNGVPEGAIQNFTLLVGVLLSDLTEDYAGNFTVWPGTHHQYEAYFREHTPQSLLNGIPPVDLPEPHQIHGKAGDIILTHYQLAHAAALNVSPYIRYALFFRLTHVDHDTQKWESMTDIWLEYAGMQEIVAAKRNQQPLESI